MAVTARFAACKGRPLGERKGSPNTYSWCAWWTSEPVYSPFTAPDAVGGARRREDVPGLVQATAPAGAELKWLPAYWAQEWREVQRHGVEARAQLHAQHEREFEERVRETKAKMADPLWQWRMRQQTEEWIRFRDALTAPGSMRPPEWAELLGLPATFTLDDVARAFRARAFTVHPDRGGDHEKFVALVRARDAALAHLGASA